jgi:hypothetical protein
MRVSAVRFWTAPAPMFPGERGLDLILADP